MEIIVTLKRSNNAINRFHIEKVYIKTHAITVTNQRFNLNSAYEELKHRLDIWTGLGSGWIIDKIEDIHIDIANYDPLAGSSYIPLPSELNHPMKGLINIKNKDIECFKQCHIRFINPTNSHPERINKQDKKIAANLNYSDIVFPLDINDYEKIEDRFQMQVNVFGYENKVYPLYISKKSYNQTLNLLLITEKDKSHYVFIKDFNRLMFSKQKINTKNTFVCHVYKILLLKKY